MRKKNNLVLRLASLLLVCVLISSYALCGLLAKYATSGSTSDEARIAKFESVEVIESGTYITDGNKNVFYVIPGVNLTKDVAIDFNASETSAYVFVEMVLVDSIDAWTRTENTSGDQYTLKIIGVDTLLFNVESGAGKWKYHIAETIDDYGSGTHATRYVYYKEVAPHDDINEEDFIADNGLITVSPQITRTMIKNGNFNNLKIDIRAIAVQASGFKDVTDAWTSVKND